MRALVEQFEQIYDAFADAWLEVAMGATHPEARQRRERKLRGSVPPVPSTLEGWPELAAGSPTRPAARALQHA
jgi:hypothetical protein